MMTGFEKLPNAHVSKLLGPISFLGCLVLTAKYADWLGVPFVSRAGVSVKKLSLKNRVWASAVGSSVSFCSRLQLDF